MRGRAGFSGGSAVGIAAVALVGDAVLITASVLHRLVEEEGRLGFLTLGRWNGNRDGTFAELWGGLQLALAAGVLLVLAVLLRRRNRRSRTFMVYLAWAAVLLTIAADDYFMVHERGGEFIVDTFALTGGLGLRGQDLGELLVWMVLAVILGVLLAVGHLQAPRRGRRDSLVFLALTVFLAAFGVVLDMLNIALHDVVDGAALTITTHVETGGELVAMTFLLLWAVHLLARERAEVESTAQVEGLRVARAPDVRPAPAGTTSG
jgi:hypothetical protein